ncbi:lysozyme g isoform X1 [Salvelinus sp. IW2-2015]|uniref:lysozyme g isoform X1 n=1 Tax=Salvelinus sp. IW2-2015 TaxID=2691554 RepID=UPI000CDF7079|nr:lysozyme g [Salvelinus alpinus]
MGVGVGIGGFITFFTLASCFGDITKVDTSGASEITARQDKLTVQGVDASHKLAEHDLVRMNKYKKLITKVGQKHGLDPAIIAGIISRESRAGAVLDNGWGDHGNGFGLMQVDKRYHKIVGTWDSEEHISQGTEILIEFIRRIQAKFPAWPKEHQLKGGISAYNAGDKNVRTYERMDVGTTGDDYSNDVVARSQWFKRQGY